MIQLSVADLTKLKRLAADWHMMDLQPVRWVHGLNDQWLRLTSTTPVTGLGVDHYPGVVIHWDPETDAWYDGDTIWVRFENTGIAVDTTTRRIGYQKDYLTISGSDRPLFAVVDGTGTSWQLTVKRTDGVQTVVPCTTINFEAAYFTVTDSGSGVAYISLVAAAALTVQDDAGGVIVTPCDLISFEADHFTLTSLGSGDVYVAWDGVTVRKNGGANVGTRPRLNFIEGSNVTLTVTDDGVNGEVDVTIAASAAAAVDEKVKAGSTDAAAGYLIDKLASETDNIRIQEDTTNDWVEVDCLWRTSVSADTTLDNEDHATVYVNAATGNKSITLPASPTDGKVFIIKKTDSSSNTVSIVGSIDGITNPKLYLQYDFLGIQYDNTEWRVISDGLRPHKFNLGGGSASVSGSTKIIFASEGFDYGGIGDQPNSRGVVLRAGQYFARGRITATAIADQKKVKVGINGTTGTTVVSQTISVASPATDSADLEVTALLDLAASGTIELYADHTDTGSKTFNQGVLEVFEIRPGRLG